VIKVEVKPAERRAAGELAPIRKYRKHRGSQVVTG
jgi:hypothetical protein